MFYTVNATMTRYYDIKDTIEFSNKLISNFTDNLDNLHDTIIHMANLEQNSEYFENTKQQLLDAYLYLIYVQQINWYYPKNLKMLKTIHNNLFNYINKTEILFDQFVIAIKNLSGNNICEFATRSLLLNSTNLLLQLEDITPQLTIFITLSDFIAIVINNIKSFLSVSLQ